MTSPERALGAAWRAWQAHPGVPERARACEAACGVLAASHGITPTELRRALSALARMGWSIEDSIRMLFDEPEGDDE